ncbi:MAG TPA: hypothetical protein VF742_05805 [Terracidiphilus sp.]
MALLSVVEIFAGSHLQSLTWPENSTSYKPTAPSESRLATAGCRMWRDSLESQRPEGILMSPTLANGKICYIEMPASDIARSSELYKKVFGWNIRKRGDGSVAFDDALAK